MEPVYKIALREIPAPEAEIEELLDLWRADSALGIRIVDNIRTDYHIDKVVMKDFLMLLHQNRSLPIVTIQNDVYRLQCYKHGLKGPVIPTTVVSSSLLGFAKPATHFKASLKGRYKSFSDAQVDTLIDKLCSSTTPLTSAEGEIPLSPHPCWATWGPDDGDGPFHFLPPAPGVIQVLANMGLSHGQKGSDHLLFVYPKDTVNELKIPTIADGAVYSYFKCASAYQKCGYTQPWNPEDYETYGLTEKDVKPRPEGVHGSVKLKDLQRPLQLIKA